MKIVYFKSKLESTLEDKLLSAILEAMPMVEVMTFTNCHTLSEWLKVPPRFFFAVILYSDNEQSLIELMPLRRLLVDRKIILIVSDQKEKTIDLAYKFRPNYIHLMHDDRSALLSILRNWLDNFKEIDKHINVST